MIKQHPSAATHRRSAGGSDWIHANLVFAHVKAGGAREQRGRAALPYVTKAMDAAKAITSNPKGRNPYDLLCDAEDVLRPLEIAHRHVAA
jgi:hypothetical protein